MTISGDNSFPSRLTKIDDLTRGDHSFLKAEDECLFFGEYSVRMGPRFSTTNQLISNFKMPVQHRGTPRWYYKTQAIKEVAGAFSRILGARLEHLTLVPVPPSKLKTDLEYDDRMMDMLRELRAPHGIRPDIRELVRQNQPMQAAHASANRPRPVEWETAYEVVESLTAPAPKWIGVIDDTIITGCRFRALSNILKRRFPSVRITGLFIARGIHAAVNWSEFPNSTND